MQANRRGRPWSARPTQEDYDPRDVTERVKASYEETPFPNYDDHDSVRSLIEKARTGRQAVPPRARSRPPPSFFQDRLPCCPHTGGGFFGEFWYFIRHNKKWWLTTVIILLLLLGVLVMLGGSGAAPLIYTLF